MSQEGLSNSDGDNVSDQITQNRTEIPTVLPLEIIDRAIGSKIKILLTNNKEFAGTLIGFDDFVNVVLENVIELNEEGTLSKPIKKMLLNGAQIAMLCPTHVTTN